MAAPRKRKKEPPFDVTGIDFSVITTALQTGGKMIEQIINGIQYGSPEVRLLMLEECDFIIECRVCRGLFRALPNFIAHKRVYCCQAFCDHNPNQPFQAATAFTPPQDEPVVVLPTMPEDTASKEPGQIPQQRNLNDRSKDKDKHEHEGKPGQVNDRPKGKTSAAPGKVAVDSSSGSDSRKAGSELKQETGSERSGMKTRSRPTDKTKSTTEDHVEALTEAQVGVSKEFVTLTAAMEKIERDKETERSAAPLHLTPIPSNPCAVFVNKKNVVAGQVTSQPDVSASSHTISVSKDSPVLKKEKELVKKTENSAKLAASQKNAPQTVKTVTSTIRTASSDKPPAQSSKATVSNKPNARGAAARRAQVSIAKGTLRSVTRVVRELRMKKDEILTKKKLSSKSETRLSSQKDSSSSSNVQPKPTSTLSTIKPQFRQPVAAAVAMPNAEKQVAEITRQQKSAFVAKRGESPVSQTTDTEGNLRAVVKRCLTGRPWALRTSPLKTRSVEKGSDMDSMSNVGSSTFNEPVTYNDADEPEQEGKADDLPIMDLENLCCRVCNFKFGQKKTLVYHCQTRHSGQRTIFPCPYCQRVFYYFWGLTRHLHDNHRKHPSDIDRMRKSLRRRAYKQDMTAIPVATLQQLASLSPNSKGKEAASRRTRPSVSAKKLVAVSKAVAASAPAEHSKSLPELSGVPSRRRRVEIIKSTHSKSTKPVDVYKKVYLNKRGAVSESENQLTTSMKGRVLVAKPGLQTVQRSTPARKLVEAAKSNSSPSKESSSARKKLVARALRVTRSKKVYSVDQSPPLSPTTTPTKQLTTGSASICQSENNSPGTEAKVSLTRATKDETVTQCKQVSRSPALTEAQPAETSAKAGAVAKIGLKDSNSAASSGDTVVVNETPRTIQVSKEKDKQVSETVGVVSSGTRTQKIIVVSKEAFVGISSDKDKLKPTITASPIMLKNATAIGSSNNEQDKKIAAQPQTLVKAVAASEVLTRVVGSTVVPPSLQTRPDVKSSAASHSALATNASGSIPQNLAQVATKYSAATSPIQCKIDTSQPATQTRTRASQEISSSQGAGTGNKLVHLTRAKSQAVSTPSFWGTPAQSVQLHVCPHCQRVFGRKISLDSHAKICSKAKHQTAMTSHIEAGNNVIIVRPKLKSSEGSETVSQSSSHRVVQCSTVTASASTVTVKVNVAEKSELKMSSQLRSSSPHPNQSRRETPTRDLRQTGSTGTKNEGISSSNQRSRNPNSHNASSSRESSVESRSTNDPEIQPSDQIVERESRSRRKADSKTNSSRDSSVDSIKTRSSDTKQSQPPSRTESASSTRSSRDRSADASGKGSQLEKAKLEENLLAISRQRLSQQLHAATTTRETDGTKESSSSRSVLPEGKGKIDPVKLSPTKLVLEKVLPQRAVTTTVLRKNPREKSLEGTKNSHGLRSVGSAQDNPPSQPSRPGGTAHPPCPVETSQRSQGEVSTVVVMEKRLPQTEKKGTLQVKLSHIGNNQPPLLHAGQATSKGGDPATAPKVNHQGSGAATSDQSPKEATEGLSQRPRRKRRAPSKVVESMESYTESTSSDSCKRIHLDLDRDDGSNDSSGVTGPAAKQGAYCLTAKGEGSKGEETAADEEESVTIVEEIWMEKKPGRPTERIKSNRIYVVEPARAGRLTCQDTRKVGQIVDESGLTCLQCDQNFTSVSNLRRHAIRHLGWRRFKCRLCRFCSYNRSECNTHIMRTHPERLRSSGSGGARIDTFITDLGRQGASVRSLKKRQTLDSRRQQGEKEGGEAGVQRTSRRKTTGEQQEVNSPELGTDTRGAPTPTTPTRSSSRRKLTTPTACEVLQASLTPPVNTTATNIMPPTVIKITHPSLTTTSLAAPTSTVPAPITSASTTPRTSVSPALPVSIKPVPPMTTNPTLPASTKSTPPTTFNISTRNSPREFDTRPYPRPAPVSTLNTRKGSYTKPQVSSFSQNMAQSVLEESKRTPPSVKEKPTPMTAGKESVAVGVSQRSQVIHVLPVTSTKEAVQPTKPHFVSAQETGLEKTSAGCVAKDVEKDGPGRSPAVDVEEAPATSTVVKSNSGVITRSGGTADVVSKKDGSLQLLGSNISKDATQESRMIDAKHDSVEVAGEKTGEVKEKSEEAVREDPSKMIVKRSGKDADFLAVHLEEMQSLPQQFMSEDAAMETCDEKSSTST